VPVAREGGGWVEVTMRSTEVTMEEQGSGLFGAVDPKLTIYALANGMDLVREGGTRRLEWYRDGRERRILVEATSDGTLRVSAQAWSEDDASSTSTVPQGPPHAPEALARNLSAVLNQALEAANGI